MFESRGTGDQPQAAAVPGGCQAREITSPYFKKLSSEY